MTLETHAERTDIPPETWHCRHCKRPLGACTRWALAIGTAVFKGRTVLHCKFCGRRNEWRPRGGNGDV